MNKDILNLELYRSNIDNQIIQNDIVFLAMKGIEAWNEWKDGILAELEKSYPVDANEEQKKTIRRQYEIKFNHYSFRDKVDFRFLKFPFKVSFLECTFEDEADFQNAKFFENFQCCRCTFKKLANFGSVIFLGNSFFQENQFLNHATFSYAEFKEDTFFMSVVFSDSVGFLSSTFYKEALFNDIIFHASAAFHTTRFGADVYFQTITSKEKLIFLDCIFDTSDSNNTVSFQGLQCLNKSVFMGFAFKNKSSLTPCDFRQSYFNIPPLVDDFPSDLSEFKKGNKALNRDKNFYRNSESKFRELKRLAESTNNHQKAMEFYGCELYCQRKANKFLKPNYLVNLFYEKSSGYGMSLLRPFLLWFLLMLIGITTQIYLDKKYSTIHIDTELLAFYASPSLPPFIQDAI